MRLPHCIAIFYKLPWFCSTKVNYEKSQRNAENACGNRMCKQGLRHKVSIEERIFSRKSCLNSSNFNVCLEQMFSNMIFETLDCFPNGEIAKNGFFSLKQMKILLLVISSLNYVSRESVFSFNVALQTF